jgi:hypothetical protein
VAERREAHSLKSTPCEARARLAIDALASRRSTAAF